MKIIFKEIQPAHYYKASKIHQLTFNSIGQTSKDFLGFVSTDGVKT